MQKATKNKPKKSPGGTMKKIVFICAAIAALTSCKQGEGNTTTPKGVIIEAVKALSQNRSSEFMRLLSGAAAQKYGSQQAQQELLRSLGDVRKVTLGDEKVLSNISSADSVITTSAIDVVKSGHTIYSVVTQCIQTTTSSTHTICHSRPDRPPQNDYNPPSHGGGGYHGGYDNGNDRGGGYITPGVTHEVDPATPPSEDGRKPGNDDPTRPPRYMTEFSYDNGFDQICSDVTDSNTFIDCKIIDLN